MQRVSFDDADDAAAEQRRCYVIRASFAFPGHVEQRVDRQNATRSSIAEQHTSENRREAAAQPACEGDLARDFKLHWHRRMSGRNLRSLQRAIDEIALVTGEALAPLAEHAYSGALRPARPRAQAEIEGEAAAIESRAQVRG